MAESLSFPRDLAECHRLMAQQQALFAGLEQRAAEQQALFTEQQALLAVMEQQHAEQQRRYADLDQVLSRTAEDLDQLREDHQKAIDELRLFRRWVYGSRRERHVADAKQQHLFEMGALFAEPEPSAEQSSADVEVPASAADAARAAAAKAKAALRQKKRADRKLCLDALPQVEHYPDVSPEEKVCGECKRDKNCIGEEISRVLEFVPGQLEVHNHHLKKYACTCGQCGVTTAPVPMKPIEKCIAGPGLLSSLIVSKSGDHLPTYRSEDILVRHGLHIPRSTLCDWMHRSAMLLLPFAAFITTRILKQHVLWTDDTPVMFFDRNGKPVQTKKGESSLRRGRFWPYIARGDSPYTVFDFTISRDRDGPMSMLAGWSSGYDPVIHQSNGLIIEVACWAHARRYFEQALPNDSKVSGLVLEWVRQLYDIEDRALLMPDDERLALRQAESVPILRRMGAWLKVDDEGVLSKKALPDGVLPKSSTGKAVRYVLNNWKALNVFTTDGRLTIDNNLSERTVRALAIGRANWKFIGSEPAGYRMAVLFTIMANAKRHHLEPFAYVRDLLMRMSSLCAECGVDIPDFTEASNLTGTEFRELGMSLASQLPEESLTALLPDHWAAANPKQVLVHRIEEARQVANRKRDDRQKRREVTAKSRATPPSQPGGG
jgi:transposase